MRVVAWNLLRSGLGSPSQLTGSCRLKQIVLVRYLAVYALLSHFLLVICGSFISGSLFPQLTFSHALFTKTWDRAIEVVCAKWKELGESNVTSAILSKLLLV